MASAHTKLTCAGARAQARARARAQAQAQAQARTSISTKKHVPWHNKVVISRSGKQSARSCIYRAIQSAKNTARNQWRHKVSAPGRTKHTHSHAYEWERVKQRKQEEEKDKVDLKHELNWNLCTHT